MSTPSTTQLLEATLPDLLNLEAGAGVSVQPTSLSQLPAGYSLTAQEAHVSGRLGVQEALAGVPAGAGPGAGDSEELVRAALLGRLGVLTQAGGQVPVGSLMLPAGTLTSMVWDKLLGRKVRDLDSTLAHPGGVYTPHWDGRDDRGAMVARAPGRYSIKPAFHQAKTDVESVHEQQVGQSSTDPNGPTTQLGLNQIECLAVSGTKFLRGNGYCEGGPALRIGDVATPNASLALRDDDKLSVIRMGSNDTHFFPFGFVVFEVNGWRGSGFVKVTQDGQHVASDKALHLDTGKGDYWLFDAQQNVFDVAIPAANNRFIYSVRAKSTKVFDASTMDLLFTLPFGGIAAAANQTHLFLGGDNDRIYKYAIGADGYPTAVADWVAGTTLTSLGALGCTPNGQEVTASNVVPRYYNLDNGTLKVGAVYVFADGHPDAVEVRTYQGDPTQSHTMQEWIDLWIAEGDAGGANFAYRRTICLSTVDHDVLAYSTSTGEQLRSMRALHGETGDYATNARVTSPYKYYFNDCKNPFNGGATAFVVTANNGWLFVNDLGNAGVRVYGANWTVLPDRAQNFISSLGSTSNITGNDDDWRDLWQYYKLYKADASSWELYANYSIAWQPGKDTSLARVKNFSDGNARALRRSGYHWELLRITPAVFLPEGDLPGDLGSGLDEDGAATFIDSYNAPQQIKRIASTYDTQGQLQYTSPAQVDHRKETNPATQMLLTDIRGSRTKSGIRFFYNVGNGANYAHVAALRPLSTGDTDFYAETQFPISANYPAGKDYFGTYPLAEGKWYMNGSGTTYQGSFGITLVEEEQFLSWEKMEFFLGGGQASVGKLTDKYGRCLLTVGKVRYPAFKYGPWEKLQGGNGDSGSAHRVGNDLRIRVGQELGNGVTQLCIKDLYATLIECPELEVTEATYNPAPAPVGIDLFAGLQNYRYSKLKQGDNFGTIGQYVELETDVLALRPAGQTPDVQVKITNGNDEWLFPLPLTGDVNELLLYGLIAFPATDINTYRFGTVGVLDENKLAIVDVRHTTDGVSAALRVNSLTKFGVPDAEPYGGVVLHVGEVNQEARETYYYQPFRLHILNGAGTFQFGSYPVANFSVKPGFTDFDGTVYPTANIRRPRYLRVGSKSYGNYQGFGVNFDQVRLVVT